MRVRLNLLKSLTEFAARRRQIKFELFCVGACT